MATAGARHVPHQHPARTQPVAVLAALRWQDHPVPIDGADQITDTGHGVRVRQESPQVTTKVTGGFIAFISWPLVFRAVGFETMAALGALAPTHGKALPFARVRG
jgi:hypothetical protein